jgi:hypothetical protein
MLSLSLEVPKQHFDKSKIDRWVCMLYDIWGEDTETIKNKLIAVAQDRFLWDNNVAEYINSKISRLIN